MKNCGRGRRLLCVGGFCLGACVAMFASLPLEASAPLTPIDRELFSAIESGETDAAAAAIRGALRHGANPNAEGSVGTPLTRAILFGHVQAMEILLRAG